MPIRSSPPIRSLATANETLRRLVDPPPLIWQILPIWQRVRLVDESWVQKLYDNPPALESTKAVKRVIPLIEKLDREAHKQGQKGTCADRASHFQALQADLDEHWPLRPSFFGLVLSVS